MSGLGRETQDYLSLGHAQFQAASARGAVAAAINQTAGVVEAWAIAEQETTANKALADYREVMTSTVTNLSKSPAIPVEQIPDGVTYEKTEITPGGQTVDRVAVPSWEVAPAIYDQAHTQASGAALKQVQHRGVRAKLETSIQNAATAARDDVAKFHFEGRKQELMGKNEAAIQQLIRTPGGETDAIAVVDSMVRSGLLTPKQGVDRKVKVTHDATDLRATQALASLIEKKDIAGLEAFSVAILANEVPLTADEKRGYVRAATEQANRISAARTAAEEKAQREKSKVVLGELATKIRLEGYLPSKQELVVARETLTGADYLALIALVDRKDGGKGVVTSQPTFRSLEGQIVGLSKAGPEGTTLINRANAIDDLITTYSAEGKLAPADRDYLSNLLTKYRDRPTKASPEYSRAESTIEANIAPPQDILGRLSIEDAQRWKSLSVEMKSALADAVNADPKLDPRAWVDQNLPTYKARADQQAYTKLFSIGLGQYAVMKVGATAKEIADGTAIDREASREKIRKDARDKRITKENEKRAFDALELGDSNARSAASSARDRRK
jgi:hypothetical protein